MTSETPTPRGAVPPEDVVGGFDEPAFWRVVAQALAPRSDGSMVLHSCIFATIRKSAQLSQECMGKSMRRWAIFGLAGFLLASCGRSPDQATIPRDSYPDERAFNSGIKQYPYKATAERVKRIVDGVPSLESCMTKEEVHALLGAPDYSDVSYGPKGPHAHWLGSVWMFYISKQSDGGNVKDPRVEVFFDTTDRAKWIVPTGIAGTHEIGSPEAICAGRKLTSPFGRKT